MISRTFLLLAVLLSGCTTVGGIGGGNISGYYANRPDGTPAIRITQSFKGYEMSVGGSGTWSSPRPLTRLSTDDTSLKAIPWLANIVESAYGIDGFTFFQFRKDAKLGGESLPSLYYLAPGGWAYRVPPPATP